ncbi:MAG: RDD family protein [Geothrix sp.]|uniref:RDD family protein n=1 Tax=Geothrix sp. TaxID=1962974 RepID=UPI0017C296EB|nr:RDD family protein [Geothrix sp.]NWJ42395.1 RDD family protein [Geothrix sp.]WIL19639.1 MAG: RDD family protein [Geothrix sp.]
MDPNQTHDTYEVEAATRLSRLGAALVDGLVLAPPVIALAILVPMALMGGRVASMLVILALSLLFLLVLLITQIVLLVKHGQTVGKRALGIRMITSDGEIPSIWRVFFLRWLPFAVVATVVQLVLKVQGIGSIIHLMDVVFIFQPTRRCLHDLFADTHVIKA